MNKKLASGDSDTVPQSRDMKENISHEIHYETNYEDFADVKNTNRKVLEENKEQTNPEAISPKMVDDNEIKLKARVAQCKNLIDSLKLELNEEKSKLEKEAREVHLQAKETLYTPLSNHVYTSENEIDFADLYNVNMYSASVDSKLNCDENLMEYEKQLQRYQNTLNMAQIEKKNAIRKQMLAKAFKLKLMEVENQCNIELLRIKQSLQCLEPLQMIVEKWKVNNNDNAYDLNNFELIPRYPELSANSGSDITSTSNPDDIENEIAILNPVLKHE